MFSGRKPYHSLPDELRNDVKEFFGSYKNAQRVAADLLYSAGKVDVIESACRESMQSGIGYLDEGHSLQLHTSLIERLPPVLRCYLGCASYVYGDVELADVIKIHIKSGKLTLMMYDDFKKPIPLLMERIKVNLRTLNIDFYQYGDRYPPQPLYLKSRYMAEDQEGYGVQKDFDEALQRLNLFDFSGFGPSQHEFISILQKEGIEIHGFRVGRV